MTVRRLFVEAPPEAGVAALDPATARHAVRVLRMADGDPVVLFDGGGREWDGVIRRARKGNLLVDVGAARTAGRFPGPRVVLASGIPKGKRLSRLVSMATETGVDHLVLLVGRRSAVRELPPSALQRLRRTVAQAGRQSGRAWLPDIEGPVEVGAFLSRTIRPGEARLLPTTVGSPPPLPALAPSLGTAATAILLVGPEGGFTEDEETAARFAGFLPVSLGPAVMRVETAGPVGVAMVRALAQPVADDHTVSGPGAG